MTAATSQQRRTKRAAAGGIGATILAVLAKGKGALALLKAVPVGKALLSSATFALFVATYAARQGVWFAVGFGLLLMIHELGHGAAMRAAGIRAGWPVFIPFLGAFIAMKDHPADPLVEARVAYAGPVAGTGASLACAALGLWTRAPIFFALAYSGFFLNLFNMVPLGFLDGSRVARVFSRGAWIVGIAIFGALFLVSPSPQLGIIGVMSLMQALRRPAADLDAIAKSDRRAWAARYFGLCAFLAAGMACSHVLIDGAH